MHLTPRSDTLVVHFWGGLLSCVLFALHIAIMSAMAFGLFAMAVPLKHCLHVLLVGPVLIFTCFLVLFLTHLLEGAIWAVFLWRKRLMDDFGEAVYFSLTSFSAVGYGDVVLKKPWRALGAIMAVSGLLLFGCSTAFLFLVLQRTWSLME